MDYKKMWTVVQITFIIFLLGSMLYFAGKFISLQTSTSELVLSQIPENQRNIIENNTGENITFAKKSIVVPSVISVCSNGESYSSLFAGELCESIWSLCKGYLKNIDIQSINKLHFDNDTQKNDYISGILNSEACIYLDFYNDIHSAVLFLLMSENTNLHGLTFMVNDVFIYADSDNYLNLCFVNSDGQLYYINNKSTMFNKDALFAYNYKAEFISSKIVAINNNNYTPLFEKSLSNNNICILNKSNYFGIEPQTEFAEKFLELFGFNPNNTRYFKSMGNITFVEDNVEAEVSPDGRITITASDEGIDLETILGYMPENIDRRYLFSQKILAVKQLLNNFSTLFYSDGVILCVNNVYSDNEGALEFELVCKYNGIVIDDEEYRGKIIIRDNGLVYAQLCCVELVPTQDINSQISMFRAYELAFTEHKESLRGFKVVYGKDYKNDGGTVYSNMFISEIVSNNIEEEAQK